MGDAAGDGAAVRGDGAASRRPVSARSASLWEASGWTTAGGRGGRSWATSGTETTPPMPTTPTPTVAAVVLVSMLNPASASAPTAVPPTGRAALRRVRARARAARASVHGRQPVEVAAAGRLLRRGELVHPGHQVPAVAVGGAGRQAHRLAPLAVQGADLLDRQVQQLGGVGVGAPLDVDEHADGLLQAVLRARLGSGSRAGGAAEGDQDGAGVRALGVLECVGQRAADEAAGLAAAADQPGGETAGVRLHRGAEPGGGTPISGPGAGGQLVDGGAAGHASATRTAAPPRRLASYIASSAAASSWTPLVGSGSQPRPMDSPTVGTAGSPSAG